MTTPAETTVASRRGRVDWRFLLPFSSEGFEHLVLLGGTPALADRIVETGIAAQVSAELSAEQSADAVVALSHTAAPLPHLARCLRPGGALYYEVDRRSLRRLADGPGRVQRRMVRAGLTPTGLFWAAPNFAECKRYVPLDTPEALRWYLSALYVAGSPLHRLWEMGVRLCLAALPGGFAAVAPCFALTARNGSAVAAQPVAAPQPALSHLLDETTARPMVITSGQDDGSRSVVLPFQPGHRQPQAALKVASHPRLNGNTDHEQAALGELHARLADSLRDTVPRPLGQQRLGGLTISMESCASGRSLVVTSGRWPASFAQQVDDLRLAVKWLGEFQRQTQTGAGWDEAAIQRWIEKPLAAYAQIFGVTPAEAALFARVRSTARTLQGARLPMVWMHYDFAPWNLFRGPETFTVIDWEFGRAWEHDRFGPALYDLLYFLTYWYHMVKRLHTETAELRGLRQLFIAPVPGDRLAVAAQQVLVKHLAALNIDARFVPLMHVCLWLEQALHRYARRKVLGDFPANPRAGNRCIGYLGVLAKHADQLFAERSAPDAPAISPRTLARDV